MKIDRESLKSYATCIKGLTNEELHREVWMLDEHIKYLSSIGQISEDYVEFLRMAKEEKETRMVSQGYQ